ncbi:hypothetical protein BKP42_58530 [Rhodococcus erythropolis]|nr:hypothetical protein BKP42_58530 [Rhodococcus erythropolis]
MHSATGNRARLRVPNRWRWYISFFSVAKNDSAAAVPQRTPARPTLIRTSSVWHSYQIMLLCNGFHGCE